MIDNDRVVAFQLAGRVTNYQGKYNNTRGSSAEASKIYKEFEHAQIQPEDAS